MTRGGNSEGRGRRDREGRREGDVDREDGEMVRVNVN